ncbi:MAG: OmpA family protein [Polyangiaceae bacterium]|nr:OmpA family protein [Polyangiaceae bacterium]
MARRTTPPLLLAALTSLAGQVSAQPTPAGQASAPSTPAGQASAPSTPAGPALDPSTPPTVVLDAYYAMPTLSGSTGLLRVAGAMMPPAGTFRVQALYEYFRASGFLCSPERLCSNLVASDRVTRAGLAFAASAAVTNYLEGYLALRSYSTENTFGDPSLLQTLGDATLGVKAALPYEPGRFLHAGGDLQLSFVQGSGGVGVDTSALSGRLRGNASFDLRALAPRLPLVAHLNLGYRLDNSGSVVENVETDRGRPVSRIERYGLNVNRVDFVEAGLGVEALLSPGGGVRTLRPFVEYTLDAPLNRQGYTCTSARLSPGDQCLGDRSGFSSAPSRLSLGARVNPWLKGLMATLAFDLGVSGTSTFVEEVSPQAPWTLWAGLGYVASVDDRAPEPHIIVISPPPNPRYVVDGFVHEARAANGVAEAIIHLEGGEGTGLLTDATGHFRTAPFAPGSYRFRVRAAGYYDATCSALVSSAAAPLTVPGSSSAAPATGPATPMVAVDCPLEALPRSGALRGRVLSGEGGAPLAGASVVVVDSVGAEHPATTDASGAFRVEGLPPGPTRLRVSQDTHFDASALADVKARDEVAVNVSLHRRPTAPNVSIGKREIALKRQVHFEPNSAKILPDSGTLLEEMADVLQKNPRLKRVEIQGHTDSTGNVPRNRELSQERAAAVRERLVALGIAPERLTAKGYGDERPLVPNVTAANRARNRARASGPLADARASGPLASALGSLFIARALGPLFAVCALACSTPPSSEAGGEGRPPPTPPSAPVAPVAPAPSAPEVVPPEPASSAPSAASAPAASASAAPAPPLDPSNRVKPPPPGDELAARAAHLFEAVRDDDPPKAADFFFPREPFVPLKDVADGGRYWDTLFRTYKNDVRELHRRHRRELEGASFVGLELGSNPTWVKPGEEYNKIGYYRTFHARLRYRTAAGADRSLDVHTLISWQGAWYITHLSPFKK